MVHRHRCAQPYGIPAESGAMKLYSYVVARDYGFAPNPFDGVCTLATCKPDIRQRAVVGDWVVGLASKQDKPESSLVYAMRVDKVLTYDAYWNDARFQAKKPSRASSVKQLFGDNIYHRNEQGCWLQLDSHHSLDNGLPNQRNIDNDTKSEGVLISEHFAYWGSRAIPVPSEFLDFDGHSLQLNRGYKTHFPPGFAEAFVTWFEGLNVKGFLAPPFMWQRPGSRWARLAS